MFYLIKTPWWLKRIYPGCIWEIQTTRKVLYLTFDDGPHPVATPIVLDVLKEYNARATFFCIGKNVLENFQLYTRLIDEGHRVGNHTNTHCNAWKVKEQDYLKDVEEAKKSIDSTIFRPPYGRISNFLVKNLKGAKYNLQTIMWTVLSGDFDKNITPEVCYLNVVNNAESGAIVVFHDSAKALVNMEGSLRKVLTFYTEKGYCFESLPF